MRVEPRRKAEEGCAAALLRAHVVRGERVGAAQAARAVLEWRRQSVERQSMKGSGRSRKGNGWSRTGGGRSRDDSGRARECSGRSKKGSGRSRDGSGRSRKGSGRSRKGSGRSRKGSGRSRKGSGSSRKASHRVAATERRKECVARSGELRFVAALHDEQTALGLVDIGEVDKDRDIPAVDQAGDGGEVPSDSREKALNSLERQ